MGNCTGHYLDVNDFSERRLLVPIPLRARRRRPINRRPPETVAPSHLSQNSFSRMKKKGHKQNFEQSINRAIWGSITGTGCAYEQQRLRLARLHVSIRLRCALLQLPRCSSDSWASSSSSVWWWSASSLSPHLMGSWLMLGDLGAGAAAAD